MSLPRLSGAIRAFGPVSPEWQQIESTSSTDLVSKRQKLARRQAQRTLSWQELSSIVKTRNSRENVETITEKLRHLLQIARQLVGEETDPDYVEACGVLLFETFQDAETVTQAETTRLRRVFGPFPASAATQACTTVKALVSAASAHALDQLAQKRGKESPAQETDKPFGDGIKFVSPLDSAPLEDVSELEWLDFESPEAVAGSEFTMAYQPQPAAAASVRQDTGAMSAPALDGSWLQRRVEAQFTSGSGISATDMCSTIFEILTSAKTDDQLQNDLFELLGFDRFEFIQELIQNRRRVIESSFAATGSGFSSGSRGGADAKALAASSGIVADASRPNFGCQVTIQTEDERRLQKALRREEKKENRRKRGGDDVMDAQDNIDPLLWRQQRELALLHAKRQPALRSDRGGGLPGSGRREVYPNVYDALAEARANSSYVGGSKMLLPEGTEKKDFKMYEEVNIPPSQPAPLAVGNRLIPISDLDEIGQVAFPGTKSLNRIQSLVFEAAYNSNENLLVCAPTGAGKTNVAMLTILHELRQHLSQGVIKKDEFKIVYVAPMKALAAEMVRNFGRRLEPLGLAVRELTGDMQLTKTEIMNTQMLVTTPEKWDVVTRKSTGDVALTQIVRLLIIDEVHLLHDDRGAVIESLVARTLRQVESSQSMIRIIGLSATLPNYIDVARFLHVNPYTGLFFFDGRFRPVPLAQTFIGIKTTSKMQQLQDFNTVCYDKVLEQARQGQQTMVFVHARNETVRTAQALAECARNKGESSFFAPAQTAQYGEASRVIAKSRNKQLRELFEDGFAIHHAGMLRQDRNLVERYFAEGHIRCLVCTATLAWGVNLPAHAVFIKGTQLYDAKRGAFVDLGILDVQQIFGRAGRPQYDTYGHGTILTTHDKLSHYLALLTQQNPIESRFLTSLTDNLNAEVSLGSVTNIDEAVKWMSYTYLFVRMRANPLAYGINYQALQDDPTLAEQRRDFVTIAARALDKARMARFDERTGYLHATDLGRTSSHFYIKYDTVEVVNEMFRSVMAEDKVFEMISKSHEFEQIKVREEELSELDEHLNETCVLPVAGGSENNYGKVNILLQTYISRGAVTCFSLVSDQAYVAQNSARIVRALFEVALRKGWPIMAGRLLTLSKTIEKRLWAFEHPLRQFSTLQVEVMNKLEACKLSVDKLREMDAKDIGLMVHHVRMGPRIKQCVEQIPQVALEATIQPITRTVLRVRLTVTATFRWNDKVHGSASESFWIWVEDPENNHIYHSEYFMLHKKHVSRRAEPQTLVFTIPIFEPLPSQYYVRAVSDRWLGSETVEAISFRHLILPERHPPHTELLDLQPLPITALNDHRLEALFKFTHFNPVQTQIFHTLYHTDCNVLLGAPTGSGKTIAAELAIFRVFREYPGAKCVYIAPLKALVRERIDDWKVRIEAKLGKKVVELTGDVTPDMRAVAAADLIVTTPEKWDGISRSWQTRGYVKAVRLLVIDEIHLLGDDRGPVLEVIVSRTNFISSHTSHQVRVVGLSTALANARDLADWLGIKQMGLFNFRPSVRPVPLEVHIAGFPGKHYCPRMATMNKPTFQAIRTHSAAKPALVFVSSRRQTRLTALDLIAFLAAEEDPKQWLHMPELEMENIISGIRDSNLKLTLAFGIGLHHAGLHERDRKVCEELFCNSKIQVLIATSTLAWGVNFPAHLVVVKGTEYFDGKTRRYVDFPITDVLQMMGRAGRPQYDDQGKAVILVHDVKKHFYKKFLYEPFPVESNLLEVLAEHLNAEIVAGTIGSKQDAMDYITWTYFFRRLVMNPSFYELEDTGHESINRYLSNLVERALLDLESAFCIQTLEDNLTLEACTLGRIASYYYLHHNTVRMFREELTANAQLNDVIQVLSQAHEYADLPVRHNEDSINGDLARELPLPVNQYALDSSHTKTHLLLQAHFCQLPLPSSDYLTDTKSVLDQAIRILQAMLDVSGDQGWLVTALSITNLLQMVVQGRWLSDSTLLTMPHVQPYHLACFRRKAGRGGGAELLETLPELIAHVHGDFTVLSDMLGREMSREQITQIVGVLNQLPDLELSLNIKGWWESGPGREEARPVPRPSTGRRSEADWVAVHADQEYVLHVSFTRLNRIRRKDAHAHAPRFPKSKDEGWFLILGDVETRELVALKRVSYIRGRQSVPLAFYTPKREGRKIYTLYLMSDSYLGLDQQLDVCLHVLPPSIEAQVNSELTAELDGMDLGN